MPIDLPPQAVLPPPALYRESKARRLYPDLSRRFHKHARLLRAARTRYIRQHPRSLLAAYAAFRAGDSRQAVEIAWSASQTPQWKRTILRCVARHESGGRADVWYGGSRGWQGGRFVGTDRVNGYFQIRPYHVPGHPRTVTFKSYLYTSDPVWSAVWSAHTNLQQAFAADRGVCHF